MVEERADGALVVGPSGSCGAPSLRTGNDHGWVPTCPNLFVAASEGTLGAQRQNSRYLSTCCENRHGCPAWIRTTIDGVRVRSLTIRRRGSLGAGEIEMEPQPCQRRQGSAPSGPSALPTVTRRVAQRPPFVIKTRPSQPLVSGGAGQKRALAWRRESPVRRFRGKHIGRRTGHRTRARRNGVSHIAEPMAQSILEPTTAGF